MTTSNSTRYYVFYRAYKNDIFLAVSKLCLSMFTRDVLELITFEKIENISLILRALCEMPVVPAPNLRYEIKLTRGIAKLGFSSNEEVEDTGVIQEILFS
jgi:hypothetical protein